MIKYYKDLDGKERFILYYSNALDAIREAYDMSVLFEQAPSLDKDKLSEKAKLKIASVKALKRLGYSLDEAGTYLYAYLICEVVSRIKDAFCLKGSVDTKSLLEELTEAESQLYFDIARDDLEIGINKYHEYLEKAIASIDPKNADPKLVRRIYSDDCNEVDYGTNAFIISRYLLGIKTNPSSRSKPPKVNKLNRQESHLLTNFLKKF